MNYSSDVINAEYCSEDTEMNFAASVGQPISNWSTKCKK